MTKVIRVSSNITVQDRVNMILSSGIKVLDLVGKDVIVDKWILYEKSDYEENDNEYEDEKKIVLTMLEKNNEICYSTVSKTFINNFKIIMDAIEQESDNNFTIRITESKSKNNRTFIQCFLVDYIKKE